MTSDLALYARVVREAASNDVAGVAATLDSMNTDVEHIVAGLLRLRIGRLVLGTLARSEDHADHVVAVGIRAAFERAGVPAFVDATALLGAFVEIRDVLVRAGIPVMLLKGVVLADRLYGGIDHRPQDDVDLLVRREEARRAGQLVESLGYRRLRRDGHATTFERGTLKIDLHRSLRSAPAYAIDEEIAWRTAREETIAGTRLLTASDEVNLTLLVTSLVEDIAFGMAKMKNLCDIWLLTRHIDQTADWERWFALRASEGLESIALNGGVVALLALDRVNDAPAFMRAVHRRPEQVRVSDGTHALALVSTEKGSAEGMAWMGQIYPGWLVGFRLHPFVSGLPGTLRELRTDWFRHQFDLRRTRRELRTAR